MEEKIIATPEDVVESIDKIIHTQRLLENLIESVEEFGFKLADTPYNKYLKEIHVFQGIYTLAEIFGCNVNINNSWSKEYPYYLSFEHDGLTYFQLQKTEAAK